jgi:uncharacterized protein
MSIPYTDLHRLHLRQDTLAHLQALGIYTIAQLAALSPDQLRTFKGIKSTAGQVHAKACALHAQQPIWHGHLPPICADPGYMFDIETIPYTEQIWSIGWCDPDGQLYTAVCAPIEEPVTATLPDGRAVLLVPDPDQLWAAFAEAIPVDSRPVYHWTGFDTSVMRKTAAESVCAHILPRSQDLHRVYKNAVCFPVENGSLKTVAGWLGFGWSAYAAWDQAYDDYRCFLTTGDGAALARACSYQRDDVEAMRVVWSWLVANAPAR